MLKLYVYTVISIRFTFSQQLSRENNIIYFSLFGISVNRALLNGTGFEFV